MKTKINKTKPITIVEPTSKQEIKIDVDKATQDAIKLALITGIAIGMLIGAAIIRVMK